MPFIDVLKALASQLIVLHHLAIYGPLSVSMNEVAPTFVAWLSEYGRLAVPLFLVAAGFLSARGLAPSGIPVRIQPLAMIGKRYMRLAVPYLVAVVCALACAAVARTWMQDEATPAAPTIRQVLAHVFMMENVLGFDAVSAGVWYVAIDFQLYAMMVGLIWACQNGAGVASTTQRTMILVSAAGLASLMYFNLDQAWDMWGVYFFGTYALGALAYWAASSRRASVWMFVLALAGVAVLAFEFRTRIAVALVTALALAAGYRYRLFQGLSPKGTVAFLAKTSYSTFLIHYPVSLLVNTAFDNLVKVNQPGVTTTAFVLAWMASIGAGTLLYRYVETGPIFNVRTRSVPA